MKKFKQELYGDGTLFQRSDNRRISLLRANCKIALTVCLVVGFLWSCTDNNLGTTRTVTLPPVALQADFDQLVGELNNNPKVFTDLAAYNGFVQEQRARLVEPMSLMDFYRVLNAVVAKIQCGHTQLHLPENRNLFYRILPLDVHVEKGHAYVMNNHTAEDIAVGSELLTINGKPIEQIMNNLLDTISADGGNLSGKYGIVNADGFKYLYATNVEDADIYEIEVRPPGSEATARYELKSVRSRGTGNSAFAQSQISTRHETDYSVLDINSFYCYDNAADCISNFRHTVSSFFLHVKENHIPNLIVDVRDNGGGDPNLSAHILSYLISTPFIYFSSDVPYFPELTDAPVNPQAEVFTGNVYVLINGYGFSGTGHFTSLLAYHNSGSFTFIGQEVGSGYLCTDASVSTVLSHSGFHLRNSREIFRTEVTGMSLGEGVSPDYETAWSVESAIGNIDNEMEKAISLIRSSP